MIPLKVSTGRGREYKWHKQGVTRASGALAGACTMSPTASTVARMSHLVELINSESCMQAPIGYQGNLRKKGQVCLNDHSIVGRVMATGHGPVWPVSLTAVWTQHLQVSRQSQHNAHCWGPCRVWMAVQQHPKRAWRAAGGWECQRRGLDGNNHVHLLFHDEK